jgi:tRNA-Thr(GGU) m(6)t(6)A37 methyltransferase TsaA
MSNQLHLVVKLIYTWFLIAAMFVGRSYGFHRRVLMISPRIAIRLWSQGHITRDRQKITEESRWHISAIGVVESSYQHKFGVPKQATIGSAADPCRTAIIRLFPNFRNGLLGLKDFDYMWIVSYMHVNTGYKLTIKPQPSADAVGPVPVEVGLFSSRAPHRPTPIAISAVRITDVNMSEGTISVLGIDLLDNTPVLDIKPYIPAFDSFPDAAAGWMDSIRGRGPEATAAARAFGYQTIRSVRGERAARAAIRKQAALLSVKNSSADDT